MAFSSVYVQKKNFCAAKSAARAENTSRHCILVFGLLLLVFQSFFKWVTPLSLNLVYFFALFCLKCFAVLLHIFSFSLSLSSPQHTLDFVLTLSFGRSQLEASLVLKMPFFVFNFSFSSSSAPPKEEHQHFYSKQQKLKANVQFCFEAIQSAKVTWTKTLQAFNRVVFLCTW